MRKLLWSAVLVATLGCEGSLLGPRSETPGNPTGPGPTGPRAPRGEVPVPFACDAQQTPAELPLRRLSRTEYVNTVQAFARVALPTSGGAVLTAIGSQLGTVPGDSMVKPLGDTHGGYTRLDQTTQQATVDATYDVAVALAKEATSTPARLTELMGACATDSNTSNDASCLGALVDKLGPVAVRHALSADDRAFSSRPQAPPPSLLTRSPMCSR
jgi:hypothetical protein